MKKITKTYDVYTFNELDEKAQSRVLNETIRFYLEVMDYIELSKEMQNACDKAEEMRTPWFVGEYIMEYAGDEIREKARLAEYLENGELFTE